QPCVEWVRGPGPSMECLRGVLHVDARKLLLEEFERILTQTRRDFLSEYLHALARELGGHVTDMELNQQISDFRLFDEFPDAPINRLGTADDNRLRGVQ